MLKFCLVTLVYVQLALGGARTNPVDEKYVRPLEHSGKIIHGYRTDIRRVPFQVSLGDYYPYFKYYNSRCGGSIISENWVVSAAHCLRTRAGEPTGVETVSAGSTDVTDMTQSFHHIVEAVYPSVKNSSNEGDIVLLRVDVPFKFDAYRQPVRLFEQNEEIVPGTYAIATGWGENHNGQVQENLLLARFPMISNEECNRLADFYHLMRMRIDEICGGYIRGGVCRGDSGGPLTVRGRLAGVVAGGFPPCDGLIPARYTAISHYRDWIRRIAGV